MAWLEAAKQEILPEETLRVWFIEFQRLGWSDEIFRERVTATLRSTTYGKIKFDDFINAERLYTAEEANQLADRIIEKRKEWLAHAESRLDVFEREAERQGLIDFRVMYERRYAAALETRKAELESRIKKAEVFVRKSDDATKERIKEILIDRGLWTNDGFWKDTIHFFTPHILGDIERMMRGIE